MKATALVVIATYCLALGQVRADTTWNVADDFDWTNNPNGDWSYGYHAAGLPDSTQGVFVLFDGYTHTFLPSEPLVGHCRTTVIDPNLTLNPTATAYTNWGITWDPGELSIGTYPSDSNSVGAGARWTAPSAGSYSIASTFIQNQIPGTSMPVYVYHNNTPLFSGETGDGVGSSTSFSNPIVVMAVGDTIDFISHGGAHVELRAEIAKVPEPSVLALLGLGALCLVGLSRY
ncbi:MAG: PEP-CTERM sorting domain-containing protein [Pirellulales bacterium]|nr:PEP-CTERM sorting domain-containing protein [Pirellulales bacterium]